MLHKLPNDILIRFILYKPLIYTNISKYIYNIICSNRNIIEKLLNGYYYLFDLNKHSIYKTHNIFCKYNLFKHSKIISYFFNNNLSIYEKKLFIATLNIPYKRYYWVNNFYKLFAQYINFYIIYYTINQYDMLLDELNIYVDKDKIISTEIPISNPFIKHYLLYKDTKTLKYSFIIKPDTYLNFSLHLLNNYLN